MMLSNSWMLLMNNLCASLQFPSSLPKVMLCNYRSFRNKKQEYSVRKCSGQRIVILSLCKSLLPRAATQSESPFHLGGFLLQRRRTNVIGDGRSQGGEVSYMEQEVRGNQLLCLSSFCASLLQGNTMIGFYF